MFAPRSIQLRGADVHDQTARRQRMSRTSGNRFSDKDMRHSRSRRRSIALSGTKTEKLSEEEWLALVVGRWAWPVVPAVRVAFVPAPSPPTPPRLDRLS